MVRLIGLRNPCGQINNFQPGLLAAVLHHAEDGSLIRKAGVVETVEVGGNIARGDRITITLPPLPHKKLERV